MFIAGHVLQGLCTSLLLIAAAPPLAIGFPAEQAARHRRDHEHVHLRRGRARPVHRRPAGRVARLAAAVLDRRRDLASRRSCWPLLTFEDAPPANPDAPRDLPAIALAAVGCVAAFFGASELTTHRFLDAVDARAAARRPGADRRPDRLPVQRHAAAADDPHDAHEHDPGRGHRRRAVRGGRVGVGDRADRRRARRRTTARCTSGCSTCPSSAAP